MKLRVESPFDTDEEAQAVVESSEHMDDNSSVDWQQRAEGHPYQLRLDGNFTVAELFALIHFHPVLRQERTEAVPAPKSDEVRILSAGLRAMTVKMNQLIVDCMDEKGEPKAPSRKILMQSRACLPPSYSMSLTKKKEDTP